jgi:hypothetical protein
MDNSNSTKGSAHTNNDTRNDHQDKVPLNLVDDLSPVTPPQAETTHDDGVDETVPDFLFPNNLSSHYEVDILRVGGSDHVMIQRDSFTHYITAHVITGVRTPRSQGLVEEGNIRLRSSIQHLLVPDQSNNNLRDFVPDVDSVSVSYPDDDDLPPLLVMPDQVIINDYDDSDNEELIEEIEDLLSLTCHGLEEPDHLPEFDH